MRRHRADDCVDGTVGLRVGAGDGRKVSLEEEGSVGVSFLVELGEVERNQRSSEKSKD
jgi:hypothetical protein